MAATAITNNGTVKMKLTQYRIHLRHLGKYFSGFPVIGLARITPLNSGRTS